MRPAFVAAVLLFICVSAPAQIVSRAGTMDITVAVQQTHVDAHTDRSGAVQHNIDLRSISAMVTVEYSLTDRLAFGVSVPYIRSRYRGPAPHPGAIVDDGAAHGSLQDLQADARYALIRGDFVVSPFAGFRYPAQDYATIGHASPGRGLKEFEMGVSAGHQLRALPNAFIGANGSYTISEALHEIRVNRTNADLQLGYAVGQRVFVRGFGAWQRSHGGIDLPIPVTSEHFHHHDQLARANHTRLGAGLIVSLNDSVNLHISYATVVRSINAHLGRSVSVGTSWTFTPSTRLRKQAAAAPSFYGAF